MVDEAGMRPRASPDAPVLVVGASGNVGSAVVAALAERDVPVRAGALHPGHDARPGVTSVALDLTDPTTFGAAVGDARAMFLVRPPAVSRVGPTLNALVDVAAAADVQHVVFSSVAGADTNPIVPHHRVERHLQDTDVDWTILRPGFFAQNLADAYRQDIAEDDRLHVPAGPGRVAFIDARDIGEVAARVLADPSGHERRGYHLTGPEALTYEEVAALLTDLLGRPVRYEPASVLGYLRHLAQQGRPVPLVVVQTILHVGLRRGDAEEVTDTLPRLLGRPARTLHDYVRDHLEVWQRSGGELTS